MNALILDPFSGASGDMLLGALVDVGVPFEPLRDAILAIPELDGVTIEAKPVTRGVFAATHVSVQCPPSNHHRSLTTIRRLIETASLPERAQAGAVRTFTRLAEAEAKVHGSDVDSVHFHEVGALDAIVDIVGVHVALGMLGDPAVYTRTLALGSGETDSEHGRIPVPAPATVELLAGFPVAYAERREELVTPTGAALVATLARPLPGSTRWVPQRVGHGAGTRDGGDMPNVLRVIQADVWEAKAALGVITTTIDDMNPESYGHLIETLMQVGALDVYYSPIIMKKNRPGVEVTVICDDANTVPIANHLMTHTTTLGVRITREDRLELPRQRGVVATPYGAIDIKIARRPDGRTTMSPEYESCRRAAAAAGVPLLSVYEAAHVSWAAGGGNK